MSGGMLGAEQVQVTMLMLAVGYLGEKMNYSTFSINSTRRVGR